MWHHNTPASTQYGQASNGPFDPSPGSSAISFVFFWGSLGAVLRVFYFHFMGQNVCYQMIVLMCSRSSSLTQSE